MTPRDVAQYVVGYLGEDSAIYKALEYGGPYIQSLSIEDRMLFPLMSIDLGAKAAFINPDEKTVAFARALSSFKDFELMTNDPDVQYEKVDRHRRQQLEPQVACPPTVGNVKPVREVAGIPIQIAEIGGSTGGRLDDLRVCRARFAESGSLPEFGCRLCRQSAASTGGAARRADRNAARCRRDHLPAERRLESGRQHGRDGRRRSDDLESGAQLSRPQRPSEGAALSGVREYGCGFRAEGGNLRSPRRDG